MCREWQEMMSSGVVVGGAGFKRVWWRGCMVEVCGGRTIRCKYFIPFVRIFNVFCAYF